MKRPQFSIRLMLLVVALFAAIFGWWNAVNVLKYERNQTLRMNLEATLWSLERDREYLLDYGRRTVLDDLAILPDIAGVDSKIAAVRKKLDALKP